MTRKACAYLNLDNLRHNFALLRSLAEPAQLMAVVKADAYGHGLAHVASTLATMGCRQFAVTDAEEGVKLRLILGKRGEIALLSGIFDSEEARACAEHDLEPVLNDPRQLEWLSQARFCGSAWLKVDSGMHRLGCASPKAMMAKAECLRIRIRGVLSHLACADTPHHPMNFKQIQAFKRTLADLPADIPASLLNSAGLVAFRDAKMDVVRPGIALYGVEPVSSRKIGLKPVMRMTGRVIQVRIVEKGEAISYGASFVAPKKMTIAIVGLGYGDGLPWSLSNRGSAWCRRAKLNIVGRICMDYCLLDAEGADLAPDDEVEFWGDALPAADVAQAAGTIAYELFTRIPARVRRLPINP